MEKKISEELSTQHLVGCSVGQYKILEFIADGAFSKVYLGRNIKDGSKVALKITIIKSHQKKFRKASLTDDDCIELFDNETNALKQLDHPGIISLIKSDLKATIKLDGWDTLRALLLVTPFHRKPPLFDYFEEGRPFSMPVARYFFKQIAEALAQVHDNGMAHRDIKGENILLDSDYNVKLIDFGFATKKIICPRALGTEGYRAPEVIKGEPHSPMAADIFTLGGLLFIMVTMRPPFKAATMEDKQYKLLVSGFWETFWQRHAKWQGVDISYYDEDFMSLVTGMLMSNPAQRPSIHEVLQHPWV